VFKSFHSSNLSKLDGFNMVIHCKKSLNALDLLAIVRELKPLHQAYISNVYQISDNIFQFKFGGFKCNVIFELGRRVNVSGFDFEKPKMPTNFCSFLRSRIVRAKILEVSQVGFDRIVSFKLSNGLSLFFEFMDGGNILLLDSDGRIVGVYRERESAGRRLFNGEIYSPPKVRGFNPMDCMVDEAYNMLMGVEGSLVVALTRVLNLPGEVAEELCLRCGLDKNLKASSIDRSSFENIINVFRDMVSSIIDGSINPQIILDEGKIVSVVPLDFQIYSGFEAEYFKNFNEAVDEYFHRLMAIEFEDLKAKVRGEVEGRFKASIEKQRETLKNFEEEAAKLRRLGNLIMGNLNFIDEVLSLVRDSALKYGWGGVLDGIRILKPEIYERICGFNAKDRILMFRVDGEIVPLNVLESAASNASRLFNEAKVLEGKASRAREAIKSLEDKMALEVEEEVSRRVAKPIKVTAIVKRRWYENFHWFKSSDGLIVVGGRDASQNEALVRKWLRDDGIYVHADVHGGPSVIILSESSSIPESTIYEAAQFAVSFSNAWRGMMESASAFWVYGKQVSKSAPSGEYLSRGAFMIYGRKNYIHNIPLRVSIGLMPSDYGCILVSGPPSAISKWCFKSITLAPGIEPIEKLWVKFKKLLSSELDENLRGVVGSLSMDDFRRILPRGGFRLIPPQN
jgi:predicted ribosome quality control (RQC) complex YloA/Tae2 family protein